jgi:riboflavin synthase alpha subunit
VQGACLTVTRAAEGLFEADLLDETLARTALRRFGRGSAGEHSSARWRWATVWAVTSSAGHVDEVGVLDAAEDRGRDVALRWRVRRTLRVRRF